MEDCSIDDWTERNRKRSVADSRQPSVSDGDCRNACQRLFRTVHRKFVAERNRCLASVSTTRRSSSAPDSADIGTPEQRPCRNLEPVKLSTSELEGRLWYRTNRLLYWNLKLGAETTGKRLQEYHICILFIIYPSESLIRLKAYGQYTVSQKHHSFIN